MPKYNEKNDAINLSPENKKIIKNLIRYNIEDKVKKIIDDEVEYIRSFKRRAPY